MKRTVVLLASVALAVGLLAGCGGGSKTAVHTLVVQSHDPANSATGEFLRDWASRLDKVSNGRIKLDIHDGGTMGGPKDTLSLIDSGTADIGFGLCSYFSGTFKSSEAISLPMVNLPTASVASKVFWHLYADYPYLKDEYKNYHVLLLFANCQSPISTTKIKLDNINQLKGMNVRANGGPPTEFIKKLGAAPKPMPITEVNTALQTGALGGVITDWHAIESFQLYQPIKYYADENIGVSGYFLLMNKASYDKLPADLRKILDSNSGEACLGYCGQYWSNWQDKARADAQKDGDTIYKLPADQEAKLKAAADATTKDWIASHQNGQAIVDAMNGLIAKYNQ